MKDRKLLLIHQFYKTEWDTSLSFTFLAAESKLVNLSILDKKPFGFMIFESLYLTLQRAVLVGFFCFSFFNVRFFPSSVFPLLTMFCLMSKTLAFALHFFSQQHNQVHHSDAFQNLTYFQINIFCLYSMFFEVELVLIFFYGGLIH